MDSYQPLNLFTFIYYTKELQKRKLSVFTSKFKIQISLTSSKEKFKKNINIWSTTFLALLSLRVLILILGEDILIYKRLLISILLSVFRFIARGNFLWRHPHMVLLTYTVLRDSIWLFYFMTPGQTQYKFKD